MLRTEDEPDEMELLSIEGSMESEDIYGSKTFKQLLKELAKRTPTALLQSASTFNL